MKQTRGSARGAEEQFASKPAPRMPRTPEPAPTSRQWLFTVIALLVIVSVLFWYVALR